MAARMDGSVYIGNDVEDRHAMTSVEVPRGATSIAKNAFRHYRRLTSVSLPNTVTSIGYEAFFNCSSLTAINFPPNITSICRYAFYGCSSLTAIDLPPNLKWIGERVFYECSSLVSIDLPPNIAFIGDCAFCGCSSLAAINLPPNITSFGVDIFHDCTSLVSVTIQQPADSHAHSKSLQLFAQAVNSMTPPNLATWASTHDAYGRLPLMTAAALSMQWTDMERIFNSYKSAILEEDNTVTGLTVSALAAVGSKSDLESVYQLCMQNPAALMSAMTVQGNDESTISIDVQEIQSSRRKRQKK